MNRMFQQTYHIPGTLTANLEIISTVPADCQLVHVSAGNTADSDATFSIGTTADTDAYLLSSAVGGLKVPAEFERTDFVGDQYPHLSDGDKLEIAVDFDGAGGVAAADLTIVLTFTEG